MSLIKDVRDIILMENIDFKNIITLGVIQEKTPQLCIRQYGGDGLDKITDLEEAHLQLYCRTQNYEEGYEILENIREIFKQDKAWIFSDWEYRQFIEKTSILEVGKNEFTFNFIVLRIKK